MARGEWRQNTAWWLCGFEPTQSDSPTIANSHQRLAFEKQQVMPWWSRDEQEAVDVEAAHLRHPHSGIHSADPWPAGPFGLAPQFEHQRSHLWGAGKLNL